MMEATKHKLNILFICHHSRNKVFPRTYSMARALVQRGHRATILAIAERSRWGIKESRWDGIRFIETPDLFWGKMRSGWDIWDMLNRLYFLNVDKAKYDLIHCHGTRPITIYPALNLSRKLKTPIFIDWIDWFGRGGLIEINRPKWYRMLFGWLETYYEEGFLSNAIGITVISNALKERAVSLGVPRDHVLYLPGGTHPNRFHVRSREECRQKLDFPPSEPILGFSSGDSHLDLEIVMQSLEVVARKYPSVKLLITGRINDKVIALAEKYHVANRLIRTGFLPIEDLPVYLSCADLFVLPFPNTKYNLGRWPNKINDYMCLGRPIVSNPVGEIKMLFERHEIGLLAEWSVEDFSQKILSILGRPDLAQQMVENALRVAREEYAWDVLVSGLEDFYIKVLTDYPLQDNPKNQ
jgi:glycosyltransferase involved in cell wall biosynthesis